MLPIPVALPWWEWRTFAHRLGGLRRRFAKAEPLGSQAVDETCLLCTRSSHYARIQDGRLDLAWRKQVHPDGAELWDRVLSSSFPCPAEFIQRLFRIWAVEPGELGRAAYTPAQFLREVIRPHPFLMAVQAHKEEQSFRLDGAACTFEQIRALGRRLDGFRIEHEDPALICDALHDLGLDGHDNVNYPEALKRALGLTPD